MAAVGRVVVGGVGGPAEAHLARVGGVGVAVAAKVGAERVQDAVGVEGGVIARAEGQGMGRRRGSDGGGHDGRSAAVGDGRGASVGDRHPCHGRGHGRHRLPHHRDGALAHRRPRRGGDGESERAHDQLGALDHVGLAALLDEPEVRLRLIDDLREGQLRRVAQLRADLVGLLHERHRSRRASRRGLRFRTRRRSWRCGSHANSELHSSN